MQHPLCWEEGKREKGTHLHPAKPLNLLSVPLQDPCSGRQHLLHPQTLLERPLPAQVSSQEGGVFEEPSEELQKSLCPASSGL